MAKIVVFSDLHLHPFKAYGQITPEGYNSRLMDAVACIDQVINHAYKVKAAFVLFGGDFWHTRRQVETSALNLGLDAISRFGQIPVFMIHGNHDQSTSAGTIHSAHPFSHLSNVTVINEPGWIDTGLGFDILGIPYTENREKVAELCANKRPGLRKKILLAHLGVQGAMVGADFVYNNIADCTVEDLHPHNFDMGFLGHYHLPQQLSKNLHYVGAPLQHNWGDRGQTRGFIEYDTDSKKVKHIACKAPQFIELEDIGGWDLARLSGNYVRLFSDDEYSADRREETQKRIGSRSFEVVKRVLEKEAVTVRSNLTPGESYDVIIDKYIESKGTDLDATRLAQLGRDILKEVL